MRTNGAQSIKPGLVCYVALTATHTLAGLPELFRRSRFLLKHGIDSTQQAQAATVRAPAATDCFDAGRLLSLVQWSVARRSAGVLHAQPSGALILLAWL